MREGITILCRVIRSPQMKVTSEQRSEGISRCLGKNNQKNALKCFHQSCIRALTPKGHSLLSPRTLMKDIYTGRCLNGSSIPHVLA